MGVVEAVQREVEALGEEAQQSTMAETALSLARELDDQERSIVCPECEHEIEHRDRNSATSKSMCAKSLVDVMRELRMLAPAKKETDDLARLRDERDRRRAGLAAAQDSART